jgi:site-specific DNA-methyltransferase (adenine-specific)
MRLLLGDCIDKLKELEDNSVDSIVTDPPYGLSFMGKKWDYDVPSQEIFEECLRVLKPGGHLLSFAGSRTYHRMAVRVEDAGFEIRDQIMWIYGSGFPKSMNIGVKVDEKLGNKRELVERPKSEQRPNADNNRDKNKDIGGFAMSDNKYKSVGNSEWEGWGTALKPSHEPIVMARKPLSEKTVVDNVLEWGTGGINIDDSRISTDDNLGGGATKGSVLSIDGFDRPWMHDEEKMKEFSDKMKEKVEHAQTLGRFPANIIFDEEAGKILDEQSGISKSTKGDPNRGTYKKAMFANSEFNKVGAEYDDSGGASRFFYCPKTSKTDRNEGLDDFEEKSRSDANKMMGKSGNFKTGSGNDRTTEFKNNHPTVKPTDLMLYLIRLVTPKGGTTLDPFMGSGSSGKAAVRGGFDFVGVEREEEYMKIAKARIQYEQDNPYNEETNTRVHINKNSNKFW